MKSQEENVDVCMTRTRLRHRLRQHIRNDPELNGETGVCWCNGIMYPHLNKKKSHSIYINIYKLIKPYCSIL